MRLLVFPKIGGKANGALLGRRRVCELTERLYRYRDQGYLVQLGLACIDGPRPRLPTTTFSKSPIASLRVPSAL